MNANNTEEEEEVQPIGRRVIYPTWKSLITDILSNGKEGPDIMKGITKQSEEIIKQLEVFAQRNASFLPDLIAKVVQDTGASYKPGVPLEDINDQIDHFVIGRNEFHTIYSIQEFQYIFVSDKTEEILGINKEDFSFSNLYSGKGELKICHPDDIYHVLRWGNLSYIVLSTPEMEFKAYDDHYKVRHRILSNKLSNNNADDPRYVVVEKNCYLCHFAENKSKLNPNLHIDRWVVLGEEDDFLVRPMFVTSNGQQSSMNSLLYLLNAAILNMPIKYLLLLNEKLTSDRNKEVAVKVCEKVKNYTGIDIQLDDQQVADCFNKTIRRNLTNIKKKWTNADKSEKVLKSDAEAISCALRFGLIPIPRDVEKLMIKNLVTGGKIIEGVKF